MTARLKKIGTAAALAAWRDQLRTAPVPKHELRVCVGGSCLAAGAQKVVDALQSAVAEAGVAKAAVQHLLPAAAPLIALADFALERDR